jgi:hypothetical protein|tara:strand:+ start:475 stop:750 length:276 start_codon:yes stop_codon:yes gene_type:complete
MATLSRLAVAQRHAKKACEERAIPGGGKDFFPLDTWLLLPDALEIRPAELLKRAMDKELYMRGQLRENVVNEIRNCLKVCDDVPGTVLALL